MTQENVIRKVQALLAKTAENGATEAEAASAVAMAQDILFKHNMTMAQVGTADEKGGDPMVSEREELNENRFYGQWRTILAAGVCGANFCELLKSSHGAIIFIGAATDVRVSLETWRWLVGQIEYRCDLDWMSEGRLGDQTPGRFRKEYYWGAMRRISTRLRDDFKRRQNEKQEWFNGSDSEYKAQAGAMVICKDDNLSRYMRKEHSRIRISRIGLTLGRGNGYQMGDRAGTAMPLKNQERVTE